MSKPRDDLTAAERRERWERRRLPLLFAALLAFVLLSRLDFGRQWLGSGGAVGFPLLAALIAVGPYRESDLAGLAYAVGAAFLLATLSWVLAHERLGDAAAVVRWAVLGAPVFGAVLQGLGAARGVRSFSAAWLGMGAAFALYFSGHRGAGKDAFDALLAAALVSLFVGGGPGFLLGLLATAIGKRRSG